MYGNKNFTEFQESKERIDAIDKTWRYGSEDERAALMHQFHFESIDEGLEVLKSK